MRREEIASRLPEVFERTADNPGKPLSALLDVMEAMQAPSEAALEQLDRYFDARRAPGARGGHPLWSGVGDIQWSS